MSIFSDKRGNLIEIVLSPMFRVMIVLVVGILVLNWVSSVGKSSYYEREFLVRDIGLVIEALHAAPNNVSLDYPDTKGMAISFEKNRVLSYEYDKKTRYSTFPIIPSKLELLKKEFKPRVEEVDDKKMGPYKFELSFQKNRNDIIPESEKTNIQKEKEQGIYDYIYTKNPDWLDEKISVIVLPENNDFGKAICRNLYLKKSTIVPSESNCGLAQNPESIEGSKLVIIILIVEDTQSTEEINVKYLITADDKSKKLQHIIMNKISNAGLSNGEGGEIGQYIMISDDIIEKIKDKPVVIIEITNPDSFKEDNIKTISGAIHDGLKEYYTA